MNQSFNLITFLQLAGASHLALLVAGIMMPQVVGMRSELRRLPEFLRQLFWTYYLFIGTTILGFGLLTFFCAEQLAAGDPFARAVGSFLALFWLARFAVAVAVFKMDRYLTNPLFKIGYFLLNALFLYSVIVYAIAAFHHFK